MELKNGTINVMLNNRGYRSSKRIRSNTLDSIKEQYKRFLKSSICNATKGYTYFICWHKAYMSGGRTIESKICSYIAYNNMVIAYKEVGFSPINQIESEARNYINYLIRINVVDYL